MLKNINNIILIAVIFFTPISCYYNNYYKNCINLTQTEIDVYLKNHPDLPEIDKTCIKNYWFEEGMRSATVIFLLGEPNDRETLLVPWQEVEKWIYGKCGELIFYVEDGIVTGFEEL